MKLILSGKVSFLFLSNNICLRTIKNEYKFVIIEDVISDVYIRYQYKMNGYTWQSFITQIIC